MYLKMSIINSTGTYSENLKRLQASLHKADAVVIGAGAGLSTSAGFTYTGKRFQDNFADFIEKYGFHDMYTGGFFPYPTPEEYWAYWSRYIACNRYEDPPKSTYLYLLELVKEKDYFVLTTNVDHCFQKAGFDQNRLFATQGDYGLFQCSEPCCNKTFDNEAVVRQMVNQQKEMRIPKALVPICPYCGRKLTMHLRCDDRFIEDENWHKAAERYENYLSRHHNQNILFLELGVGLNTPVIIKYPFWHMTQDNEKAVYACVNIDYAVCPQSMEGQALLLQADIDKVLQELLRVQ